MALETVTIPVLPIVRNHLIINCVIVLLTLVVVSLRIASRIVSGAWLGRDDWLILLSVPQGIAMLVIQGLCELDSSRKLDHQELIMMSQMCPWEWAMTSWKHCRILKLFRS